MADPLIASKLRSAANALSFVLVQVCVVKQEKSKVVFRHESVVGSSGDELTARLLARTLCRCWARPLQPDYVDYKVIVYRIRRASGKKPRSAKLITTVS